MTCPNCSGVQWKRDRHILRDVDFCLTCGFTCEAPGTGLSWATAVSAFVLGLAASVQAETAEDDHRQA
jgi:hypothetical protein